MQQADDLTPVMARTPDPASPPPAPVRRRRRWHLLWLLPLLLLLTLLAGATWLTATRSGFAALWPLLERATAGQLHVGRSEGTLWRGFTLQDVRWQSPTHKLALSHVQLAWQPSQLWHRQLLVSQLNLGALRLSSSAPPDNRPVTAPASLQLPLDVVIGQLHLAALHLGDGEALLRNVELGYTYRQQRHSLVLQQLDSRWGSMHASLALGAASPFALAGELDYRGELQGVATRGHLQLQQSLLSPQVAGTVSALGLSADLAARLQPFAPGALQRLQQLDVRMGGINPQALNPAWPQARLGLAVQLAPAPTGRLQGGVALINYDSGPSSAGKLPLSLLNGAFGITGETLQLDDIVAQLAGGSARLNGRLSPQALALTAQLQQLDTRAIAASLPSHRISGALQLRGSPHAPQLDLALASGKIALDGRVRMPAPRTLLLQNVLLRTGAGRLQLDGKATLGATPQLVLDGKLAALNPAAIDPQWPSGSISGQLAANVKLAPQPAGQIRLQLTPGLLSGARLGGQLAAVWQAQRLQALNADLQLGGNSLRIQGAYGQPGDSLQLRIDAPQLGLLGPAFSGLVRGQVQVSGVPAQPQLKADLDAQGLRLPGALAVGNLQFKAETGLRNDSPFRIQLAARDLAQADNRLARLSLQADGRRDAHSLALQADGELQGHAQRVQLQLNGGLLPGSEAGWRGSLRQLDAAGWVPLKLAQPVPLQLSAGKVLLGGGRWQALGAQWQLGDTQWQAAGGWRSSGHVQSLALAALSPWLSLPLKQSLVFDAGWQLSGAQGWPQGSVQLQRTQGDLWLAAPGGEQALGLSRAAATLGLGERGAFTLALDTRFGHAAADGSILWGNGSQPAAAPLLGKVQLVVPSLALAQPWLKPGMELSGALAATLQLGGTVQAPTLDGPLLGRGLRFVERRNGIRLEEGQLRARLAGQQLLIEQLSFGKQAELSGHGRIELFRATPEVALVLDFKRFLALDKPGRRLLVSGQTQVEVRQQVVTLGGKLTVDEGRFDVPKLGGPRLSEDVVVIGREVADDTGNSWPLALDLQVMLGDNVRFNGNGLEAWLTGDIRLLAQKGGKLQARGQIRVERGRFKSYGQDLDISRGLITFSGPLDNPAMDVRATRRLSPVGAGVELTGSVLTPTVKLIADESMSEKDKLSWLVLGRAAGVSESGSETAGATAGGLLAGLVNDRLGLFDDVGVLSRAESTSATGTVSPAEQVVTLGKQLTRELYVGYEYGLRSAEQALKVSYQLSRTLSVIGRAGREASSELRYTLRFD